jgi:hypothetical protein
MDNINKIIVNCDTNEIAIIPLSDDELKTLEQEAIKEEKKQLTLKTEAEKRETQRQGIADRLGLTIDELKILLG